MSNFQLAYVLVSSPTLPDPRECVAALHELGFPDARHDSGESDDATATFDLGRGRSLIVGSMPAPHPDTEHMVGPLTPPAEQLAAAPAHYIVTALGLEGDVATKDRAMAALTAAVVRSSPAVAAMLGHGRLFYDASMFAELAALSIEHGEVPIEIVVDVTAAREPGDRVSFLSHGLDRYGREDFFVTAPITGRGAVDFLLSLVGWMIADPDKELPTGDTVGRDENERVRIQREPSPVDESKTVIRLDLPA